MLRIGVVLNPRSRKNLRDPGAAARLATIVGASGQVRTAGTRDELRAIALDFARDEIDVLAISGGDGTNHVTVTGFIEVYGQRPLPRLAFLRGGTMNTVANAVGVRRGTPERLLARLVDSARRGEQLRTSDRRLMHIGEHYGFLFGAGVIHGFLAEYYRDPEPSPAVALKTLIRGTASAFAGGETAKRMTEPVRGRVEFEDETGRRGDWPEREYIAIAAGTVDQIGLGFKPFYRATEGCSGFHLVGIHASPSGLVRELPRIWRAAPMSPGAADETTATRAVVHAASGMIRYMIDGDLFDASGPVEVRIGPKVQLLTLR